MAENDSPLMSKSSRGDLMRARVGEFVEPLTRYDMNHIRLSSCAETTLPVGITQTFAIEISMADDDGVGALPGDCERVSGPKALIDRLKTNATANRRARKNWPAGMMPTDRTFTRRRPSAMCSHR
jgi:hypothetical protein